MNGIYNKLTDYIQDKIDKLQKNNSIQKQETEFRTKNFFDKYADNFMNKIISDIKGCDLSKVINENTWNFAYTMLGSDIKILDPVNPDKAFIIVKLFFKRCCEILNVELVKFELTNQVEDKLEFTIFIKNPVNPISENELYEYIKTL